MSLLSQINSVSMQEWPLLASPSLLKTLQTWELDHWACYVSQNCHSLTKRASKPADEGMPVVFMPQKSQTECERVSKLSSFGFMSFVLAIVNGVISVSNNINNNNNNRNNNNNDNNNNQFNTNLGNTNNVQMAGGMAMSGRRFQQLAKIEAIRDRLRRKMGIEVSNSTQVVPNLPIVSTPSPMHSEASRLLEELYQREVLQKQNTGEAVRNQVAYLLQQMYEEQQAKLKEDASRQSRNLIMPNFGLQRDCEAASRLVFQSSLIGLAFLQLWVDLHENDLDDRQLSHQICDILNHSKAYGKLPFIVASTIKDHLLFLLDESVDCQQK